MSQNSASDKFIESGSVGIFHTFESFTEQTVLYECFSVGSVTV